MGDYTLRVRSLTGVEERQSKRLGTQEKGRATHYASRHPPLEDFEKSRGPKEGGNTELKKQNFGGG